ncbi:MULTISPECIES: serine hydrolase [Nocardiopsidaceae]|uniref:Serine hydrolase n=1 Tax=Streptomonospora nanhaiensis TaxID=1323731 RepID=A0ABY6YJ73_9ACTN|nr:serine hydrolase [Streptomonospora nanhaiensis]WAE72367.1 serine hydrolase [Streptomonospora nanhaiensis]
MPRRPPADIIRTWSAATAAICLVVLTALAVPGATSAAGGLSAPDPALVRTLLSESALPLVPFAPLTGPATGGRTLGPAQRDELTGRMEELVGEHPADFAVAVQDLRTGATFSHGAHERFPTASVSKLTILALLLLRAEEEGRGLSASERDRAEEMIRYSDNEVTDGLYARIGFTDGFTSGVRALGFTGTDPDPRGVWGSTTTTAADQVRLLRILYVGEGPLSPESRAYARGLMESVAPEQAWGVSASAVPGDTVGLKNGWTPREGNRGLWTVNTVGYVSGPDHEYLIAVLSDGSHDYATGVALVEEVCGTVTEAMEEARGDGGPVPSPRGPAR